MTLKRLVAPASALVLLLAWSPPALAADPEHAFVGAEKCKMCHNSPGKGAQFTQWSRSRHAKAFATLASDEAKRIAAALGIADPQKDEKCLRCHVTGHGVSAAMLTDNYKAKEGVSCESCHGPGGDYWKMDVMKDRAKSVAAGLIIPDEKTCTGCHNSENPTFKGFEYKAMLAQVAHPNPQSGAGK